MFVDLENALPLTVGVQLQLLDRAKRPVLAVPTSGGRITVDAASVDGDGNVTAPGRTRVVITLSRDDLRQFDVAQFVASSLVLSTTPGSAAVRIRASDYVKVRAWSVLSWRVNG